MFQEDIILVKRLASEIADEKIAKALAEFKALLPKTEEKAAKKSDSSDFIKEVRETKKL